VISDRYSDSRYAYQQVTLAPFIPDPLLWLRSVHGTWTILPDRTYLLTIPITDALERLDGKDGREHFEQAGVLESVQKNYLALAEENPRRFVLVDALQEREKICTFIAGDIRSLWQSLQ
jgi:dTMP kinase